MDNQGVFKRRICPAFEISKVGGCRWFYIDITYDNGNLSLIGVWHSHGQIYEDLSNDSLVPAMGYVYEDLVKIQQIWKRWHQNDLRSGTPKQEECVRKWLELGHNYDFTRVCEVLTANNLLYDNGHKYGSRWIREEVPTEVVKYLFSLPAINGAKWSDIDCVPIDIEEFLKIINIPR